MIHMSKGDHADHPGHSQGACPLRITVNAHIYGTSRNGYACSATGGHCQQSEHCAARVAESDNEPNYIIE